MKPFSLGLPARRSSPNRWWLLACFLLLGPLALWVWADEIQLTATPQELAARRTKIAALSPAEKDQLKRKWEWFSNADPATRDELRRLHLAVQQREDTARLESLMERYQEWVSLLSPELQRELRSLSSAERVEKIRHIKRMQTAFQRLTKQEMDALLVWLNQWAATKFSKEDPNLKFLKEMKFGSRFRPSERSMWFIFAKLSESDFEALVKNLSSDKHQYLSSLPTLDDRRRHLGMWLMSTGYRGFAQLPKVPDAKLQEFYQQLPPSQKDRLEGLPPERFDDELLRAYRMQQAGEFTRPDGENRPPSEGKSPPNKSGMIPRPGTKFPMPGEGNKFRDRIPVKTKPDNTPVSE